MTPYRTEGVDFLVLMNSAAKNREGGDEGMETPGFRTRIFPFFVQDFVQTSTC